MRAQQIIESSLLRLKWLAAAANFELAMRRHALALKAGFNPDQPRDDQGRWTDTGGARSSADNGQGINDSRVISDAMPDNEWKPGAQYAQNDTGRPSPSRPSGHHFVPQSLYRELPLSPETRKVFDEAKTGRLYSDRHGWSQQHDQYNKAVRESLNSFLEENGITPEQMTPDQARSFADRVKKSSDPRIRSFNMRIYMREIQYWIRRTPGRNE
jgi:hypothetical protein